MLVLFSCNTVSERKLILYKNPPITNPILNIDLKGFYYCKGPDFDVLLILFEDGKAYFHPFIKPNNPDSIFDFILNLNNNGGNVGTTEFWGNYNIIEREIFIEFIYAHYPSYTFNAIEASGIISGTNNVLINKMFCKRLNSKICKQFDNNVYNPPLIFKFYPKEFQIQKAKFYESKWYKKYVWNSNF